MINIFEGISKIVPDPEMCDLRKSKILKFKKSLFIYDTE